MKIDDFYTPVSDYYLDILSCDDTLNKNNSVKRFFNDKISGLLDSNITSGYRKPIIFVGAGISVDSGIKLWSQCIDYLSESYVNYALNSNKKYIIARSQIDMIKKLCKTKNNDPERFIDFADYLKNKYRGLGFDNNYWEESIIKLFLYNENNENYKPNKYHNIIAEMSPYIRGIITTNFDFLIEEAIIEFCKNNNFKFEVSKNVYKYYEYDRLEKDFSKDNNLFFVIKLHGCIKDNPISEKLIFCRKDYAKLNIKYGKIFNIINNIYNSCHSSIITIGYSVGDNEFLNMLSYLFNKKTGINNLIIAGKEIEKFRDISKSYNTEWKTVTRDVYNFFLLPYPISDNFSEKHYNLKVVLEIILEYFKKHYTI